MKSSLLLLIVVVVAAISMCSIVDAQNTTNATTTTTSSNSTSSNVTTTSSNSTSSNATTTTTSGTTSTADPNASNITITTTTMMPTTTTSSPMGSTTLASGTNYEGPVDTRTIRNVSCPFSRWQGEPRYCYECRWCPFRQSTCCEMEDEIAVLKSVNVSGSSDWDCFITIVHFQQCGRCDPRSLTFLMNKTLNYVWDPRGVAIRPCKQACKYIYKQCKDAKTLSGEDVVPAGVGEVEFCSEYPEISTDAVPCFESAGSVSFFMVLVFGLLMMAISMM